MVLASSVLLLVLLAPQQGFLDVGAARGIGAYQAADGMGSGLVAADFDGDSDIDFFVPTDVGTPHLLYRNLGGGRFEEIAADVGLGSVDRGRVALWFDFDGDQDLDLLVCNDDTPPPSGSHQQLFRQELDGQFTDVTASSGLGIINNRPSHLGGACAGDLNNDGYLDLYITNWFSRDYLFLNLGDGTFLDITDSSGLTSAVAVSQLQPMMVDIDRDGWLDIYVAVDFSENSLWINQGDLTFVDVAGPAGANPLANDMGVAIADYDHDGDLDLFTSNIFRFSWHNYLLRNRSTPAGLRFVDFAVQTGVQDTGWGWGTTFFDANNDGHLDLAVTNGFRASQWGPDPSRLFLHSGTRPVRYLDVSSAWGFDDWDWGSALVAADLDRDGDQDLLQTCMDGGPLRMLENQLRAPGQRRADARGLTIQPRMPGANDRAIGAEVRAVVAGTGTTRLISAGCSFFGQEPAEAFFGTAGATTVEVVEVRFPGAAGRSTLRNVPADDEILIVAPPPLTHVLVEAGRVLGGDVRSLRHARGAMRVQSTGNARQSSLAFRFGWQGPLSAREPSLFLTGSVATSVQVELALFNYQTGRFDRQAVQDLPAGRFLLRIPRTDPVAQTGPEGQLEGRVRALLPAPRIHGASGFDLVIERIVGR